MWPTSHEDMATHVRSTTLGESGVAQSGSTFQNMRKDGNVFEENIYNLRNDDSARTADRRL